MMVTSETVKATRKGVVVMVAERRVGPGRSPYLTPEGVRAELAAEAEEIPAAVELLAQILTALESTDVPANATVALAPAHTSVAVGGRIGEHDRELTVAIIGE